MPELSKEIVTFLVAFFGSEKNPLYALASKLFKVNVHLRPATDKEDTRITSPHTATAHNADATLYIPVRDKRIPTVPLVLKPITSKVEGKDVTMCYSIVLDNDKVADLAICELFASHYMAKTLVGKKAFGPLAASLFSRQSGEDIVNNVRQKEKRKASEKATLTQLANAFVKLNADSWEMVRASLAERDEALVDVVEELRSNL